MLRSSEDFSCLNNQFFDLWLDHGIFMNKYLLSNQLNYLQKKINFFWRWNFNHMYFKFDLL